MAEQKKSNKQRKAEQKSKYHSEFKPHQKPRSRKWEVRVNK